MLTIGTFATIAIIAGTAVKGIDKAIKNDPNRKKQARCLSFLDFQSCINNFKRNINQ